MIRAAFNFGKIEMFSILCRLVRQMNKIIFVSLAVFILSGCQTFSEPDNIDLNWVYAPAFARRLKTKPNDPKVYFNIIRFKILTRAAKIYFVDKKLKDVGTVFIKFNVNKNGIVEGVEIIEEDSTKNKALCEIAVEAVLKSSPFPRYYKTIKYKVLNFTIRIDFAPEIVQEFVQNESNKPDSFQLNLEPVPGLR